MAIRKHVTLVGGAVTTVTLTGNGRWLRLATHSTDTYATVSTGVLATPADPTVGGDDTFALVSPYPRLIRLPDHDGTVVVKLISSGTPVVSVSIEDDTEDD